MQRKYSPLDDLIINFDQAVRTILGEPLSTGRSDPSQNVMDVEMSESEKQLSARLMRVNHAGEVAAQALYQGQALTARSAQVQQNMKRSALEEHDHLRWCQRRVNDLGSHVSVLNPVWYLGSFTIGSVAGIAGDKWSLGFVAETERQVVTHINDHLAQLPEPDQKSRVILQQMREDEAHHATVAIKHGGVALPKPIPWLMQQMSKVMTRTAYWI